VDSSFFFFFSFFFVSDEYLLEPRQDDLWRLRRDVARGEEEEEEEGLTRICKEPLLPLFPNTTDTILSKKDETVKLYLTVEREKRWSAHDGRPFVQNCVCVCGMFKKSDQCAFFYFHIFSKC